MMAEWVRMWDKIPGMMVEWDDEIPGMMVEWDEMLPLLAYWVSMIDGKILNHQSINLFSHS